VIRLSATSIKDYLECPQRFWYRTNRPEKAVFSKHVIFGGIVHEAIEKFDEPGPAVDWAFDQWDERAGGHFAKRASRPPKDFSRMLGNYYFTIAPKLKAERIDKTEYFFRIPWTYWNKDEKIEIVGKWDRIIDSKLIDWKTSGYRPSQYQLHDIQFYTYEWAYEAIFGERPEIYYGFLQDAELIKIDMKDVLRKNYFTVVNRILDNINKPSFRVTGYQCKECFYRNICFTEMETGVVLEY